ncbi:unnamed protein product [Rhodiola kirilowii]
MSRNVSAIILLHAVTQTPILSLALLNLQDSPYSWRTDHASSPRARSKMCSCKWESMCFQPISMC